MHFSEVSKNNHAGVIWIISLLCMVYTVLTFFTRGFIKWHMLGPDDYVLVAAQVSSHHPNTHSSTMELMLISVVGFRVRPVCYAVEFAALGPWEDD